MKSRKPTTKQLLSIVKKEIQKCTKKCIGDPIDNKMFEACFEDFKRMLGQIPCQCEVNNVTVDPNDPNVIHATITLPKWIMERREK